MKDETTGKAERVRDKIEINVKCELKENIKLIVYSHRNEENLYTFFSYFYLLLKYTSHFLKNITYDPTWLQLYNL